MGSSDRNMNIHIEFTEPLRMPELEVYILKDDFTLERINWWQLKKLFDHNAEIMQRHNYINDNPLAC